MASSVVSEPSLLAQVVDVSVRSESASTRLPDSRAATRADGISAACVAAVFFGAEGALDVAASAGLAPSMSVTDRASVSVPAMKRRLLLDHGRPRPDLAGI